MFTSTQRSFGGKWNLRHLCLEFFTETVDSALVQIPFRDQNIFSFASNGVASFQAESRSSLLSTVPSESASASKCVTYEFLSIT